ncbi:hypothetical protein [Pseudoalteromonas maricaloris]|uniref:hypothetical protein n=1 Tax=Pseudoalteromonas maricaloris TaxID=184924 RepID=UPI003C2A0D57
MLFNSRDVDTFLDRFRENTKVDLQTLINKIANDTAVDSAYIVGSIPVGVGSRISDVDIYVIINKDINGGNFAPDVLNMAEQVKWYSSDDDPLVIGEAIFIINGVKVDVELLRASGIESMCNRLGSSHTLLSDSDINVFGKIRAGWALPFPSGELGEKLSSKEKAFDIYVTTKCLFTAISWFNKSMIVSGNTYVHSVLLARYAVEQCFSAYFASIGYAALRAKWVQFLMQGACQLSEFDQGNFNKIRESGLSLLFPDFESTTNEEGFIKYLEKVRGFLLVTKKVLTSSPEYKIAISLNGEMSIPNLVSLA